MTPSGLPADPALRERLKQEFSRAFSDTPGREPALAHAPGRVNLIGEHTDYNDGFVLPMALEMGVFIIFARRDDDTVRFLASDYGETAEFTLSAIEFSRSHPWLNYPQGVAAELQKRNIRLRGLDGLIYSTLPIGAGLASSAALEVASALALLQAAEMSLPTRDIALACLAAERDFVGLNCGLMDQFVSLHAQAGHALFFDTRTLDFRHIPLPPEEDYRFIIFDSGVKHSLAASAYNRRREECEEAISLLKERLPHSEALRDVSVADFDAHKEVLPEPLRKRGRHVVCENERTVAAAEGLEKGDFAAFGRLMNQSHDSLKNLYEVSCKELDLLVELARKNPAVLGSRMTGGGFGGCTVTLAEAGAAEDVCSGVIEGYEAAVGIRPRVILSSAAPAARVGELD